MQLSLWRRVAMFLLWKVLDLLSAIEEWQQRRLAKKRREVSEIRNLGPKKK
jgi:hypothetical protein